MKARWRLATALLALLVVSVVAPTPATPATPALAPPTAIATALDAPEIFALVVGYNGGAAGLPVLRFADDDAVRFAFLFAGLDAPDRRSRVWLLTDTDAETERGLSAAGLKAPPHQSPTRLSVVAALGEVEQALAARPHARAPAVLYVVYAGHGLQGRILLKPEGAPEAAMTGHELRALVAELARTAPSLQTFLFFDACRSQSLFTDRGADAGIGPDLSHAASELEARAGALSIGVLTAAASGKPAGEVRTLGSGFFSHVLASGLAGAADADGDDVVSFGELAAFVAFNTERLTGQRPWFSPPDGDLTAPAINHRASRTRLELSAALSGRYLIQAPTGRPIFAEVFKRTGRAVRLALPPGHYRVVQAAAGEPPRHAEIDLLPGQSAEVGAAATWVAHERAPLAPLARGSEELDQPDERVLDFAAPFTSDVVSTLTAGYDAGRIPQSELSSRAVHQLTLKIGLGESPLGLSGTETNVAVEYRRSLRTFFLGGQVAFARSSHTGAVSYDLERYLALVEVGVREQMVQNMELSVWGAGGVGALVRRGPEGVSGDAYAPALAAATALDFRVLPAWSVRGEFSYLMQWVRIDQSRRFSAGFLGTLGIARAF